MPEHRQAFQRELDAIDAKVIELLALVAPDLTGATHALLSGNNEVVRVLAEHELVVGLYCPEIEELAKRSILLQAPVASDLRFLLCVLRILPELERSHHLVVQIASRAKKIRSEDLSPRSRGLVEQMGNRGSGMWRQATDAWCQYGYSSAALIDEHDDEMDELYASLMAELASGRMTLPVTIEMTLMARFYGRLGDHAVNITRQTICLAGF
jgi:phosphate transport system protein